MYRSMIFGILALILIFLLIQTGLVPPRLDPVKVSLILGPMLAGYAQSFRQTPVTTVQIVVAGVILVAILYFLWIVVGPALPLMRSGMSPEVIGDILGLEVRRALDHPLIVVAFGFVSVVIASLCLWLGLNLRPALRSLTRR